MKKNLKQGDVRIGDLVRMEINPVAIGRAVTPGFVEGRVTEMAADGGVIGVEVGGVPFSAGLPFVTLLEAVAKPGDLAVVKLVGEVVKVDELGIYVKHEGYPISTRYFLNEHVTITRDRTELEEALKDV